MSRPVPTFGCTSRNMAGSACLPPLRMSAASTKLAAPSCASAQAPAHAARARSPGTWQRGRRGHAGGQLSAIAAPAPALEFAAQAAAAATASLPPPTPTDANHQAPATPAYIRRGDIITPTDLMELAGLYPYHLSAAGSFGNDSRVRIAPQQLAGLLSTAGDAAATAFSECEPRFGDAELARLKDEVAVAECLERLEGFPQTLPGFNSEAGLTVPGVADVAVVSRGGRQHDCWKGENQDTALVHTLGAADGTTGTPALLLGVFDGHGGGKRGQLASRTAAEGLASETAAQRAASPTPSSAGTCAAAAQQQAQLVAAFQLVAAGMQQDGGFENCGTTALACLLEPGSITAAWAGDSRAVLGMSVSTPLGPRLVVHALTTDHKPSSPLEQARIQATTSSKGVVTRGGRLACAGSNRSLAVSRAFGDTYALPLGLTSEPDAVTCVLPPPVPVPAFTVDPTITTCSSPGTAASSSPAPACLLDSLSSSSDNDDGDASGACASALVAAAAAEAPARHVLVLGCDGLWDVLSNSEVVAIAMSCQTAAQAASAVMGAARRKWAAAWAGDFMDDLTVIAAFLQA